MGYITRRYAIAALGFGIVEMLTGFGLSIVASSLDSDIRLSPDFNVTNNDKLATFSTVSYWWTGTPLILVGSSGVFTFCSRAGFVATCQLILSIIVFFAFCGISGIGTMVAAIWSTVVNDGHCKALVDVFGENIGCLCTVDDFSVQLAEPATCATVDTIRNLFRTISIIASLAAVGLFIGIIVSCASLCHQDHRPYRRRWFGFIIVASNTVGEESNLVNDAPPAYVAGTSQYPSQSSMQPPQYEVNEGDKATLTNNQA